MDYRFDSFVVDTVRGQLLRDGTVVPLTGKAFDMLVALLEARGELVEKESLMRRLWPDTVVEEGNLTQQISTLRKALGDSPVDRRYIATVARRGYRFVSPLLPYTRPAAASATTVGRAREAAEMQQAFEETARGRGMLLCVTGEAGIGKSTLVSQFLDGIDGPCRVLRGRCSERLAPDEPHLPVLEALEALLRDGDPAAAQLLQRRAPSWQAQVAPSAEGNVAAPSSQERQKRELASFLEELAATSPVVVWLDDIHWADLSTLDLMVYLTTRCDSTRLLLIGSYRPADMLLGQEPFVQSVRDLRSRGRCREIAVDFLTRSEVDAYLAIEFPENPFPRDLGRLLHERTEGNPLFLADLVRDLKNRGAINEPLATLAHGLPDSVRNLIERSISRLNDRDRHILAIGSVQGVEFDCAVVARAAGIGLAEVEERMARLERVHHIVRMLEAQLDVRYAFVHVLYHEALSLTLVPSRKAEMSGAVADAMLARAGEDRQRIAHQLALLYEAARRPAEGAAQFLAAARQALAVSAMREAASLSRRGLALVATLPQSPEAASLELQLLITAGPPTAATSGYANPEVERTYVRALAISRKLDDAGSAFLSMWGLWVQYHVSGKLQRALETANDLLELSERVGDQRMIAACHVIFGYTLGHMGKLSTALEHLDLAESLFDPSYHPFYAAVAALDPRVAGLAQQGRVLCLLGSEERARERSREAVALARSLHSPNAIGFALVWQAYVHQLRDEPELVREVLEEALALAAEHGLADVQGWAAMWHAWTLNDPVAALATMQYSLDAQRRFGSEIARGHQLALVADVRLRAGDEHGALDAIEEAFDHVARTEDRYYEPELHRLKAQILLRSGNGREVDAALDAALATARAQGSQLFEQKVLRSRHAVPEN